MLVLSLVIFLVKWYFLVVLEATTGLYTPTYFALNFEGFSTVFMAAGYSDNKVHLLTGKNVCY